MTPRLERHHAGCRRPGASLACYRDGSALPSKGIAATRYEGTHAEPAGAAVFFEVQGGLMPALNPRSELAKDAKVPDTPASSPEFSLAHLATSRQEVDDLLRQAEAAGATVPGTR